jgi:hypothetical protein
MMKVKGLSIGFQVLGSVFLLSLGVLFLLGLATPVAMKSSGKEVKSSTQTSRPRSRALVTKAEAEEALGGPVGKLERPPEANIPPRLTTCRYVAQRGRGVAVMTVMVRMGYSGDESRLGFQSAKEQFAEAQATPGIGDDAFWVGNQLNILQGNVYLIIGGDLELDKAKILGQRALERLR